MKRRIRRQRHRQPRRRPHRTRPIIQLHINISHAERHKPRQRLRRVRVRDAFDELVYRADGVGTDVRAGVFEDHVEDEVEEGFGEVDADLAAGVRYGVD